MNGAWGTKKLAKCMNKLGFTYVRTASSHAIYHPPKGKTNDTQRNILPIQLGIKSYGRNSRSGYIREIKAFGFTREEIKKAF